MSKFNSKVNNKSTFKIKPVKIAGLIVTAIENLRDTKGSTASKIVDYIKLASELPIGRIKPQVKASLKRGLRFGLLKRYRGHYFLQNFDNVMSRADRIAARFAKLKKPMNVDSLDVIKKSSDHFDETVSKKNNNNNKNNKNNNKNNKKIEKKNKKKKKKKFSRNFKTNQ